ncbi:MAG: type II toxin-antitoxin system VapC family toxin [Cyanobacteria bacterium J06650_10]
MTQLLLDTHIFLWLNDRPERLSKTAIESCADPTNELFLSLVSLWEIQIKSQLGKLQMSVPWPTMVQKQRDENGLQILAISEAHIEQLGSLNWYHRDPFDRLLIAQAQTEKMYLVSADGAFSHYEVTVIQ